MSCIIQCLKRTFNDERILSPSDDVDEARFLVATNLKNNRLRAALDILVVVPQLATEEFDHTFPLNHFLRANANLETIRTIYRLYPRVVSQIDINGRLPLFFACECSSRVEVIEFLLQEYPAAASRISPNSLCQYPIHFLLFHNYCQRERKNEQLPERLALQGLRALARVAPETVDDKCWTLALQYDCAREMFETLLAVKPDIPEFAFGEPFSFVFRPLYSTRNVQLLKDFILPRVSQLSITYPKIDSEDAEEVLAGWQQVLHSIKHFDSIKAFGLALWQNDKKDSAARELAAPLKDLLESDHGLEKIAFYDQRKRSGGKSYCLRCPEIVQVLSQVQHNLPAHITFVGIEVQDAAFYSLVFGRSSVTHIIAENICIVGNSQLPEECNNSRIQTLCVRHVQFLTPNESATISDDVIQEQIEYEIDQGFFETEVLSRRHRGLSIPNIFPPQPWMERKCNTRWNRTCQMMFFSRALAIPTLQTVEIKPGIPNSVFTGALSTILLQSCLTTFITPSCLKEEENRKILAEILLESNDSLQTIEIPKAHAHCKWSHNIRLLTALNRRGRQVIRGNTATPSQQVEILVAAQKSGESEIDAFFLLLRDCPNLFVHKRSDKIVEQ